MIPFIIKGDFKYYYCQGCHSICHDKSSAFIHQHTHALKRLEELK